MSHFVFIKFQRGRRNAGEGMDLLVRRKEAGTAQKLPFSMSLYRLPAEGVAKMRFGLKIWIKGVSSYLKDPD